MYKVLFIVWKHFSELKLKYNCITINVDNKAAIHISENETVNPKSRHIDVKYHHIRENI